MRVWAAISRGRQLAEKKIIGGYPFGGRNGPSQSIPGSSIKSW